MNLYSQKDPKWKSEQLGMCKNETIGSAGCKITCYAMLCGKTPLEVNQSITYSNGCLTNDSKNSEELGLKNVGKVTENPKVLCIAETNYYKSSGYSQHFFILREDGMIADPLDYPCFWKENKYKNAIVSYRVISSIEPIINDDAMNKDFVQEVALSCGKSKDFFGDNINEKEQEDAAKRLKEYREELETDVKEAENTATAQNSFILELQNKVKQLESAKPADSTAIDNYTLSQLAGAFFRKITNLR